MSDRKRVSDYITEFTRRTGSIFEFDAISQLIYSILEKYKKDTEKKVVLIVEDMDRIDPAHIFRILNIFSSHFSWNECDNRIEDRNKFGFNKIITVCDYNNLENIYHHLYGKDTDFNGYIQKFSTAIPFKYSLNRKLQKYILDNLNPSLRKYDNLSKVLAEKIVSSIISKKKNIRYIIDHIGQNPHVRDTTISLSNGINIKTYNDLTILLDLLNRFDVSYKDIKDEKDHAVTQDIYELIGSCWLVYDYWRFTDDDQQIVLYKDESYMGGMGFEYKKREDAIELININNMTRCLKGWSKLTTAENVVINKFSEYIIRYS